MKHIRRVAACILALILTICSIPQSGAVLSAYAEGEGGGRFAFAAVDQEGIVIEPCFIEYSAGDTIKDALKKSGHEFFDIDNDWINTIDGHTDNYMRYYDGGQYQLLAPASDIGVAMLFTTTEFSNTDSILGLVKVLAEHQEKPAGMKKYSPVKKAYEAAYEALPTANASKAQTVTDNLLAAYQRYETWQAQEPCKVTVKPMQSGSNVSAHVTFTDSMDNVYEMDGSSCEFNLPEETYNFVITKDRFEVSGTLDVAADETSKSISPELPSGKWFGQIRIRENDKTVSESTTDGDTTTAKIWDTTYSPYITLQPGDDIPLDSEGKADTSYAAYSEHTSFSLGKYYGDETAVNKISWSSTSKRLVQVAEPGVVDKTVRLKVVHKDEESGYTQRQYHYLVLRKIPTIKNLTVKAGNNTLGLTPEYSVKTSEYSCETIKSTVSVTGYSFDKDNTDSLASCGKYSDGYSIDVNGTPQEEDGSVQVPVTGEPITVTVHGTNGLSSSCTITVTSTAMRTVTVSRPDTDTYVNLLTSTGSLLEPDTENDTQAVFQVAAGKYSWITTKNQYYHASGEFTVSDSDVSITSTAPVKEQLLTGIATYSGTNTKAWEYQMADGETFSWGDHEYSFLMSDFATTVYLNCTFGSTVTVVREAYTMANGYKKAAGTLKSGTRELLTNLIKVGNKNNSIVLTVSRTQNNVKYYQDYHVSTRRYATLENLAASDKAGNPLVLCTNGDETDTEFDSDVNYYTLSVGEASEQIRVTCGFSNPTVATENLGDQTITIGGTSFLRSESPLTVSENIPLDPELDEETVTISLSDDVPGNEHNEYRIKVIKVPSVRVVFDTTPTNATVYITDDISGLRVTPESDGSFGLLKGFSYSYTVTSYGYVGKRGTVKVTEDKTISVELTKAEANNEIDPTIEAEWPYFRADTDNNGVVDIAVPKSADDTVMYWAKRIGEGYSANAAGCPILVDGYIYTYSGNRIVKLDAMTGEEVAEGEMVTGSAFAINSPTYAEGMIFVGLNNGGLQAFNAKTLESLWVYTDILGGQPNCQVTYNNGYIYTGYWNSETKAANFVCLSVTDEKPNLEREEKYPVWVHTGNGFYWAGSYACDDYVLVGSDDGDAGYNSKCGILFSLDPLTGVVLDKIDDMFTGDIRSSICYDKGTGRYYFVTKSGLFCSVKMNSDGTFNKSSVTRLQLTNIGGGNGMSTSTPVIYNGRAYVGVAGTGTFSQYTGHNITVIDLEGSRPVIAYKVATQGYPQTSGLLTTAYEGDDHSVYVYYFDNYTPGKLRFIKDKPGQTEPDPETLDTEEYEINGVPTTCDAASALFTPYGEHAQYAICSPIVDEWGNIYFKNDSAYMMKIGAKIKKLEVTKKPNKTNYVVGEKFDPDGMEVTATFANGKTRDVTQYVKYTTDKLTLDDTDIQLIFDTGENMSMYQNKDGVSGVKYFPPETSVSIKVTDGTFTPTELTSVTLTKDSFDYNGENQRPEIATINGLTTLIENDDYTVSWPNESKDPGAYTVSVTGKGDYAGTVTAEYSIIKQPEKLTSLELTATEFVYNEQEQKPGIKLINGKDSLKSGTDYTVSWPEASIEAGTYTVTVTGMGEYTGSVSAQYIIKEKKKIELTSLVLSKDEFEYTGETQKPIIASINGSTELEQNKDYTVTWPDESIEPDTYTVYVTGIGDYTGTVTATYTIKEPPKPEAINDFALTKTDFIFNGSDQRPAISSVNGGNELIEDTDYTVEWPIESVNADTYSVKVTGIGKYTGSVTKKYTIAPQKLVNLVLVDGAFKYNGNKQIPLIESINGSKLLTLNEDYTVIWPENPVNIGTYTVTVNGQGNYTGSISANYEIEKGQIESITLSSQDLEYTGDEQRPSIALINGTDTLLQGTDYIVTWPETSVEIGTYTVKVTGMGNYEGTASAQYNIRKEIKQLTSLELKPTEFVFNGNRQIPEIYLINETDKLKEGRDYTVEWPSSSVEPGTYTVTVTGMGEYAGSVSKQYTIKEPTKPIEITDVELSETELIYTGGPLRPDITRINGSIYLVENKDYTVTWPESSAEPGEYEVKVKGIGRFTGEAYGRYIIKEADPKKPIKSFDLTKTELTYNGKNQRPGLSTINDEIFFDELEENVDYTVEWPDESVNAGTYYVTVTGIGKYTGSVTNQYKITPQKLKTLELKNLSFKYNGKTHLPLIKSINGSTLLVLGEDYDVTWPNKSVNAGTYTVTVTGKGNYKGTAEEEYKIVKAANKLTVKPAKKTMKVNKKVKITAKAKGGAKITYKISKGKNSIKLIKKGKKYYVQSKKKGKAVITITAKATKNYKKTTKKIKVTVK